jgi:hypothetical protein
MLHTHFHLHITLQKDKREKQNRKTKQYWVAWYRLPSAVTDLTSCAAGHVGVGQLPGWRLDPKTGFPG